MPRVFVLDGAALGRSFDVDDGSSFGRIGCDVVLPDRSVSRRHARLERDGDGWALVDEGSANGISSGGVRLERLELADGDECKLGRVTLRFRTTAAAAPDGVIELEEPPAADDGAGTDVVRPRSGSSAAAERGRRAAARPVSSAEARAARLARVQREDGALARSLGGDLHQWADWQRWLVYLLAVALAGGAAFGAFRLVEMLRGG